LLYALIILEERIENGLSFTIGRLFMISFSIGWGTNARQQELKCAMKNNAKQKQKPVASVAHIFVLRRRG
jgi:hypothetical protein